MFDLIWFPVNLVLGTDITTWHPRLELSKWVCYRVCWSQYVFFFKDFNGVWLRRCLTGAAWYCTYLTLSLAVPKCPPQPSSRMTYVHVYHTLNQLGAEHQLCWTKGVLRFRRFKLREEALCHPWGHYTPIWNQGTGFNAGGLAEQFAFVGL